jgi:hypothetical protein
MRIATVQEFETSLSNTTDPVSETKITNMQTTTKNKACDRRINATN